MVDVEVQSAQSWKSSSQWHLCGDQGGWQAGSRRHLGGEGAPRRQLGGEEAPPTTQIISWLYCAPVHERIKVLCKIFKEKTNEEDHKNVFRQAREHKRLGLLPLSLVHRLGINCEINERNKTRSARLPGKDFWPFSRDWRLRPGCNPLKFTAGDKPVLLVASCLLNGKLNQYKIPSLI